MVMTVLKLLLIVPYVVTVFAVPGPPIQIRSVYTQKSSHPVPRTWTCLGRASLDHQLNLHIALRQARFDELDRRLNEISSPSHLHNGQHLTAAEVDVLISPPADAIERVEEWLSQHGIHKSMLSYSSAKDWINIALSVSGVEQLLDTEYFLYKHENGVTAVRAPKWSLPAYLHDSIEDIQPTTSFFLASEQRRSERTRRSDAEGQYADTTSLNDLAEDLLEENAPWTDFENIPADLDVSQVCNASAVTPICLRALYGSLSYKAQTPERNRMGLVNYLGETNNRSDINLYLKSYRPDAAKAGAAYAFTSEEIAGGVNSQTPATSKRGREGNLDAEVLLGTGFPTPLVTYTVGGHPPPFQPDRFTPSNTNEPFLVWLQYMLAQPDPLPYVISTSYGDTEQTIPYAYAKRVCRAFAQLGARGVTVLSGSGDSGVGRPGTCMSNDGFETPRFLVSFPESCPYVTSVGATRGIEPEVVAFNDDNGFVSGGGFSNYFPRPSWQDAAVSIYLRNLGDEHEGLYNPGGRAYPDIAVQGYRYVTVWNATKKLVDGTSASAPSMAGIVALVNDALLADGKPPLGFLNPWLYQHGFEAFTDVLNGSTKGCDTSGFPAMAGWDAASGFGTPWFPKLVELAGQNRFRTQRPWYWP